MSSIDLVQIGTRIAQRRKELNLTQEKLAEQMNVSIQMVSNLERGNKAIRIDNLLRISEILGVSTDYILTGRHNALDYSAASDKLALLRGEDYDMIDMMIDYCLNRSSSSPTNSL